MSTLEGLFCYLIIEPYAQQPKKNVRENVQACVCHNGWLIGGLAVTEEPEILHFFYGRLKPVSAWQEKLVARFRQDFGDSL